MIVRQSHRQYSILCRVKLNGRYWDIPVESILDSETLKSCPKNPLKVDRGSNLELVSTFLPAATV
jgi:hypothetical protein